MVKKRGHEIERLVKKDKRKWREEEKKMFVVTYMIEMQRLRMLQRKTTTLIQKFMTTTQFSCNVFGTLQLFIAKILTTQYLWRLQYYKSIAGDSVITVQQ